MRDLVIVLVLLAFKFIPEKPHHSLTLQRSRFRDSATATQTPGMTRQLLKWNHLYTLYWPMRLFSSILGVQEEQ